MRAAVTAVSVIVLAVSAAACNPAKKDEAPAAPGAPATAAPAPARPSLPIGPAALPHRKPGLWEMTMALEGEDARPPMVTRLCLDAASEARSSIWGAEMSKDMCSKNEIKRNLDGSWTFASVCNMGSGGVTHSEGTATGDLTDNYVVRMKSSTSGAQLDMMNRDQAFTIASRRIGACEAGQRGGDMIVNGRVVANVNDLAAATAARRARP